jgi:hypothetical protein
MDDGWKILKECFLTGSEVVTADVPRYNAVQSGLFVDQTKKLQLLAPCFIAVGLGYL